VFAVAIMTIGLNTVLTVIAGDLLGLQLRSMGDPWGIKTVALGSVFISHRQIAALVIVLIAFSALMLFFRFSRMGLAMQATSFDQEVALTQGVSVGAVFALSWAIAAALATLGGVFLGTPIGLSITASGSALKALPVVVIGGLDSFPGALVGALIVGLGETYVGTYQAQIPLLGSLGQGLAQLVPYLLMFIVLLVRPFGLFGTREVERV
jgi:branched-chain amino acid transport system permease protein